MILDKIIIAKKEEVARLNRTMPLSELKAAIRYLSSPRDFRGAISGKTCAIIAEVKRRSPSRGILREDFDPVKIASLYEGNGAAAISVLTDREFFGGDTSFLTDIKNIVSLPLLRKDFIIDPYQIYETRRLNGDALLLIAGILEEEQLREYIRLTESLGLSALVEVHSRGEVNKALIAGATLIGINNRDLKTFSTDLSTSFNIAQHIPADKVIISESGINTREDIEMLMKAGIHAFLIGESLMCSQNIGLKLKELRGNE
ncbi:MAG: indole-3-glycerol phosphate synthase TrpC [Deltaproteobacteria bacterium]|nr:indole-3-glycerol phosphate synthase TrpC [Deltaproteobacteria bacterium]